MSGPRGSILAPTVRGLFPRLLFYLLSVAAIPLIAISVQTEVSGRAMLATSRQEQLDTLAHSLARSVETYVTERQRSVAQLASLPAVRTLSAEGAWTDSVRTGAVLDLMRSITPANGGDAVMLVDRAGTVRLSTDPGLVGPYSSALPASVTAALRGDSTVGELAQDPSGRVSLHVAVPIMVDSGVPASFVLRLAPDDLWALIQGITPGATGYSVLLDSKGTVIGHSSDSTLLFTKFVEPRSADDPMGSMLSFVGTAGQGFAYAARPLDSRGWTVLVAQPEAVAFAPLNLLRDAARSTALLVFLLAAVAAAVIAWSIAQPVRRMRGALAAAAQGDLTQRVSIKPTDELGLPAVQVDGTLDALLTVASESSAAADAASTTTAQVAVASQQQAAAMAEISATIEELARSAEQVAESSESAFRLSEEARGSVRMGVESLDRIKDRSDALGQRLGDLAEMSQRIGDVADLIGEITNKTHLLSVNASIEAASAGEFGRRFAVVAQQVKQLADETRNAAGEVKGLIRQTQTAAAAAVIASESVTREVGTGVEVAQQTDQSIGAMVHQVRTISLASQQQLTANRQVADAVASTSDAVKEVALAAGELERRISALRARLDEVSSSQVAHGAEPAYAAPPSVVDPRPIGATS